MKRLCRRLPSVRALFFVSAFLVIIPLVGLGQAQLRTANARVDSAIEASDSAGRLGALLRLAPAVSAEQLSSSWDGGGSNALAGLPSGVTRVFGLNFGDSVAEDRALVDSLLSTLDATDLGTSIAAVRTGADSGTKDLFDILREYDVMLVEIGVAIDLELAVLTEAATQAGDSHVASAASVAEIAAKIQVVSSGQGLRWAQLSAAPFLEPSLGQYKKFAESVNLFRHSVADLERLLIEESQAASAWQSFSRNSDYRVLNDEYEATVDALAISGVSVSPPGPTDPADLDLGQIDIVALLAMGTQIGTTLDVSTDATDAISTVVDAALNDVAIAVEVAVADAKSSRNTTLAWIVGSGILATAAALGLALVVARPVGHMAELAESLGRGELDTRLPERGPKEIRIGAKALNDALGSLQIAEAQAIALAEERLDDPVLARSAPGELGKSLQSAVTRLATSLKERDDFQKRLAHEAAHDGLTKLANRNAILKHLDSALARTRRSSSTLALLFLDLDEFKSINDEHGHYAGDIVLRTTAQRLLASVRQGDLAGRLGGDEFIVVAEPVADIDDALNLSDRILAALSEPITFDGVTYHPSISIGIGLADGELSADEVLRDADLAVYRAKSLGKGRIDVCDEDLRREIQARTSLEHAIRAAIANDEFVLYYQPTVDTGTQEITSLEALIRWIHPDDGMIPPDSFIPIAERTDLILEIDRWVLLQAAAQLGRWHNHPTMGSLPVAVNISGRHLGSGTLCRDVKLALERHHVDPRLLTLEITETALLDDLANAAQELSHLREIGIRIALDDFGTGYMSLAHLRGLPVDVLKIDRSFVAEMETEVDAEHSLVQLIVDTGHLLGVAVTAEGVETTAQAERLFDMGSDYLQGYLFARPADAETVERDVRRYRDGQSATTATQALIPEIV